MKRKFKTIHLHGGTAKPTFADYECKTCVFYQEHVTDDGTGKCFCEPHTENKNATDWCDFYQPDVDLIEGG